MDAMSAAVVDAPITRQVFDDTISGLRDAIGDLQRLVGAIDDRLRVTQASQDTIVSRLDEERKAREGAISRIEHDVELLDGKLDKRLAEMDGKLDALVGSIERVHGTLSNFGQVLTVRDQSIAEHLERVKAVEARGLAQERTITLVTTTQAQISTELKALAGTIYGRADQPDAESLMARMSAIGADVKAGFAGQSAQIHQMQTELNGLNQRTVRIEEAQAADARKWEVRRAVVWRFGAGLARSRYFWSVVGLAVAGGVVALVPETKAIIVQVLLAFLGGQNLTQ